MNEESAKAVVLDPNVRAIAIGAVADRLHAVFKGTTGIDLDKLAASVVDELIDPIARRDYESRDAMFMRALQAAVDFAVLNTRDLEDQIKALEKEKAKLVYKVGQMRDELDLRAKRSAPKDDTEQSGVSG